MKKRMVSMLVAAAMVTVMVSGCGNTSSGETSEGADNTEKAVEEDTDSAEAENNTDGKDSYKIGVVKQMDHASLDEIANAVCAELDKIAADNGVTIEYEVQSGQGDQSVLTQIGTQFISDEMDAIIPIATLAAQVMATCAEESKTPVVFAAISDPESADMTGIDYVTGTSDALNTSFILDMMLKQNPEAKKIGLLYSLSENNSTKPIAEAKAYLDDMSWLLVFSASGWLLPGLRNLPRNWLKA